MVFKGNSPNVPTEILSVAVGVRECGVCASTQQTEFLLRRWQRVQRFCETYETLQPSWLLWLFGKQRQLHREFWFGFLFLEEPPQRADQKNQSGADQDSGTTMARGI